MLSERRERGVSLLNVVSSAPAKGVKLFYSRPTMKLEDRQGGGGGSHWGLWTAGRGCEPGMQAVFDGETMSDNWTTTPGATPTIAFTTVPAYGTSPTSRARRQG